MSKIYVAIIIIIVIIAIVVFATLGALDEMSVASSVIFSVVAIAFGGIALLGGRVNYSYAGGCDCPCGGKDDCLTCGGHENELYDQLNKILKGETPLKEVDDLHDKVEPTVSEILKLVKDNEEKLKKLAKEKPEVRKVLDHIKHLVHDVKSTHRDIITILDRI